MPGGHFIFFCTVSQMQSKSDDWNVDFEM